MDPRHEGGSPSGLAVRYGRDGPAWRRSGSADHPAIAAATEWLFNGKGSSGNPVVAPPNTPDGTISVELLRSPLMTLPAFRRQVGRLLEDRREAGRIEVVSNEEIHTAYRALTAGG